MNIEQLRYFIEVSKTNSMATAAKNLFVSSPAISQAIISLEAELHVKLFERKRTGVFLTKEGGKIAEKAQDVLLKLELLKEEASIQASIRKSELKLAICPSLFSATSMRLLNYKALYSNIFFEIIEKGSWDVINEVIIRNVDMGFTAIADTTMKKHEDELDFEILADGKTCVVVSSNHPLAGKDSISTKDLMDHSIVIYQSESQKTILNNIKKEIGFINILFISNNMELIKQTVAKGDAITIFPDLSLKVDPLVVSGKLKIIPLVGRHIEHLSYVAAWSKNKEVSAEAKHFLQYYKENFG